MTVSHLAPFLECWECLLQTVYPQMRASVSVQPHPVPFVLCGENFPSVNAGLRTRTSELGSILATVSDNRI